METLHNRTSQSHLPDSFSKRSQHNLGRTEINFKGANAESLSSELDKKSVTYTSINPPSMRTVFATVVKHRGVLWALTSVFASTVCALCIKLLAGKVFASQVLFFRGLAQIVLSAPHLTFHRVSLRFPLTVFILIILRALIGSASAFLNYLAFQAIPVATAKSLIYSSPLFTGVFAALCLKERCSVWTTLFAVLTVIAVTLVVQPPFIFGGGEVERGSVAGIICALVGAIVMAANTIVLRVMQMRRIDAQAIIFVYGFVAVICSSIVTTVLGEWNNPSCGFDRMLVIGICGTGFLEQVSVTLALKRETAMVVAILRTNDVFLSFIFDFFIFAIVPNEWTIVGAICVVVSAIGMTVSSHHADKRHREDQVHSNSENDNDDELAGLTLENES